MVWFEKKKKKISTNLPKEIMGFRDYPMSSSPRSYISSHEFLSYLISYAEHFQLNELIKFEHNVIHLRPLDATKWEVIEHHIIATNYYLLSCDVWKVKVRDLPTNTVECHVFDAIFVCNGHSSVPSLPHFKGINEFQGQQMHSHYYRRADAFKGYKFIWNNS